MSHGAGGNNDDDELYKYVLKVVILEYTNEVRFRTPILSAKDPKRQHVVANRRSMLLDSTLPNYAMKGLKAQLQDIMTKKNGLVNEKCRRSLLRLYGDLLDTKNEYELKNIDFLIPKFAAYANQELKKVGIIDEEEITTSVFKQTTDFIDMLLTVLRSKKEPDQIIISKLLERRDEFAKNRIKNEAKEEGATVSKYPTKSYRVEDMNDRLVQTTKDLFQVDNVKIQTDVFKYKDTALASCAHDDISKLKLKLDSLQRFASEDDSIAWTRRRSNLELQVKNRYKTVNKTNSLPKIPPNEEFYMLPKASQIRKLFIRLSVLLTELEIKQNNNKGLVEKTVISPQKLDFLNLIARLWLVDYPTRAAALFHACHACNALLSKENSESSQTVFLTTSINIMNECREIVGEGNIEWEQKKNWSLDDQKLWEESLILSHNQVFHSFKDCFSAIFNETEKVKFGPYLEYLEVLETDPLFDPQVSLELTKKWKKRLTKTLLKVGAKRYESYLEKLPRDDNLGVLELLKICDAIVKDIKKLQKKYKSPFLGVLNIAQTVASVTTGMFASDAKMIFNHIEAYFALRGEQIATADALEVYQSLREIRDIYQQVSVSQTPFQFDLEAKFFPYLNTWVEESDEKLQKIVDEALKKDDYIPLDLSDNEQRSSRAILDTMSIIKQYLSILGKQNWNDEFQLAQLYTKLLRSISNGAIYYSLQISSKINNELFKPENEEPKSNWLNEVKSVVNNIQNFTKSEPEVVFNFEAQTCVALNNIAALMENLTKLEGSIDPERISQSLVSYDPSLGEKFFSHVVTLRVVRAENLCLYKDPTINRINPYVSLIDVVNKKSIGRTRSMKKTLDPDWDEEFEITLPADSTLELSAMVWSDNMGQHQVCGKTFFELDPKKFKHNGFPEEIVLDLDVSGKLVIEVAVESETMDAMFAMGRAYRALNRVKAKSVSLMVEKFSGFIEHCFSKSNLKTVCAKGQPAKIEVEASVENLCDYLNLNLSVLKQYLRDDIFMEVMLAAWKELIRCADQLLLPKLSKAKIGTDSKSWQSVSTKIATVSLSTMNMFGYHSPLSVVEIETVLRWLDLLTEFFHNEGNGPSIEELKNNRYQSILLIPAFYDQPVEHLMEEIERLAPAYVQMLTARNNLSSLKGSDGFLKRAGSLSRSTTIYANATSKTRAETAKYTQEAQTDPYLSMISKEDIILRILLARGQKKFVRRRLKERTKIAYSLATERMAKMAAEKNLLR
ncbi:hypothetical protein KGF56_004000 [Candida oxycetoniae]|uniref:Uncharacterized protein n=1 Tax=Candida oxycetoniae TaxID=497107 RepID=A0AAI9WWR0_9ASCO|nr:uncharacterized protein KGF56_004000 [Candida oxycetoniae]KAI3403203.2 hypothetical protein KGF56_004000 [Candida oxycetoniae]